MKRKISIVIIICILTIIFPLNNKNVLARTIQKEFTRATEKELSDTIIIDGNVWRKVSGNSEQTYTFPENRFQYCREIGATYYIEWIEDGPGIGHFDKGKQSNYWSAKPVNGKQRGYGIWPDESLYYTMIEYAPGTQSETDFFNKSFIVKGSDGIEYTFITNNSFTDNVSFYATKETIEAFLKSNLDPNGTFNLNDYLQEAQLEQRPGKCVGIQYNIYTNYLKEFPYFEAMVDSHMKPGSPKPSSPILEWYEKNGHTYIKSGSYKDQYFNYVADTKTISIGYKATYEMETKGTMIGGKAWTWMAAQYSPSNYNRYTQATNENGDTKSANEIGINYCELLESATPTRPGAFRVEYDLPDGTKSNSIYIIPRIKEVERYSYIYFREEGSQQSLLPNRALYEQYKYNLRPGSSYTLNWTAKEIKGYEFTRSVAQTNTNKGFNDELIGEEGKTRNGRLTYDSNNDFNIIFYYKPIVKPNENLINYIQKKYSNSILYILLSCKIK